VGTYLTLGPEVEMGQATKEFPMSVPFSIIAVAFAVGAVGCAKTSSPTSPSSSISSPNTAVASSTLAVPGSAEGTLTAATDSLGPEYGSAYYNGTTVTMNEISVPQNPGALANAAADLYAVIYPPNHDLWPSAPQCNPCDHNGNGNDLPDFHDHVLDSVPSNPRHGQFNPLWHVFLVLPVDFSPTTQAAYAARLPMTSEAAVDAAVAAGVAREIDTGSYFLCAIVDAHAAR
jgi:hypothetical protein